MAEAAKVVSLDSRRTAASKTARKLSDIPPRQLACRLRHRWPMDEDLEIGRKLPRGVELVPQAGGPKMLRETCKRCGKQRWQDMLPGDVLDVHAPFGYSKPADWVTLDPDLNLGRREIRRYVFSRRAGS